MLICFKFVGQVLLPHVQGCLSFRPTLLPSSCISNKHMCCLRKVYTWVQDPKKNSKTKQPFGQERKEIPREITLKSISNLLEKNNDKMTLL